MTAQPWPRCITCGHLVAGFRGRLVHVDGQGGLVRGLDHDPVIRPGGAP